MTLSVAANLNNVPINFSDIIISAQGQIRDHITIPTNKNISDILPDDWQCPIIDLVRKTYILAENLIVSWAGDRIAAKYVLTELTNKLKRHIVSYDEIIAILLNINDLNPQSTILSINLVENNKGKTFQWDSSQSTLIKSEPWIINGSGRPYFIEFLNKVKTSKPNSNDPFESTELILGGLSSIFLAKEWFSGINLLHLFGGSFEAGFYDGNQFRLLDNYSVFFWIAEKSNGNFEFYPQDEYFRYFYAGNFFCIKKYEGIGSIPSKGEIAPGPSISLIPPLIGTPDIQAIRDNINFQKLPTTNFEPKIYYHILLVNDKYLDIPNPTNSTLIVLYYELQKNSKFFHAIETPNILKIDFKGELFDTFDTWLKSEFIRSYDKTFEP